MEKTAHTPGPWIAAPFSSKVGAPVVAASGRSVAKVTYFNLGDGYKSHDKQSDANAHLIAAAPELLAALKRLRVASTSIRDDLEAETVAALAEADTAIAKAEGQP